MLTDLIGDKKVEVKKPDSDIKLGLGEDWCPFAVRYPKRMHTRGKYKKGYPYGAVVHFTAGRSGGLKKAIDTIEGGRENGFAYLCIADSGEIVQAHPISEWGSHAGVSAWKEKLLSRIIGSVSDELVGIEINNAGKVEKTDNNKFKTWFGTYLTKDEVRFVTEEKYGCPTGYYHKYTEAQEQTLVRFLLWLKANDPVGCFDFDLVLGHHEVSGKRGIGRWRKNDPGGALSMPMDKFRDLLKSEFKKIYGRDAVKP